MLTKRQRNIINTAKESFRLNAQKQREHNNRTEPTMNVYLLAMDNAIYELEKILKEQ